MRNPHARHSTLFVIGTILTFLLILCLSSMSNKTVRATSETASMPACPTSFTVNSLADTGDAAPGNMVCDDGSGLCTLRAAIQEANALSACGVIDIDFSVTGTINTGSVLRIRHSVNINGPGANLLIVANNNSSVVLDLPDALPVVGLNGVTITGGNDTGLVAGGINNTSTLTINNCVITGNTGRFAGGMQNFNRLTILNSTISNNNAILSGFNNGGGISQSNGGTLVVTNTTISGNTATANGNANGGILIFDGTATITSCTITDNKGGASDSVGGLRRNFGSMTVRNSIVAGNRDNSTIADVGGGLISQGYNLVGNQGGESFTQPGDQAGTGAAPLDPQIGPLANNGGTTPTHALMAGSLAIDKGASFGSTTDQRGLSRIFDDTNIVPAAGGDNTDTGAFEAQTVLPWLGNYPNTTVPLSANTTITPDAAPSIVTGMSVSTSTNFKGIFTADPLTGALSVTNAHPAGTYTVMIRGFGPGGVAGRKFTLTVESGAPCADALAFANAPDVPISPHSQALAIGDFNEDGKQDFVTGYDSFDPVSLRFGNGAGGFTGTTTVSAEPFVRSIAVGDFNEDGHQDLALSNNSGIRSVSIRLGDGAGNFSGTTNVPVGAIPTSLALGDFNGDGHQDFATANEIDNTVSVRFGDGAGNFSGTTEISVGIEPQSIVIGDFNGDNKQDFATGNSTSKSASIRLGNGLGGFSSAPDVLLDIFSRCIVAGDFNGDGHQDIAVSGFSLIANQVSVRLGDGSGNFTGTTEVLVSSGPERMVTGDFNNDGNLDFATTNVGFGTISLRLGDGAGNFTGFTGSSEISVGPNPRPFGTGDFNGDGKQDFVVGHFNNSNFAAIRLNNSCPPPNTPPTITAAGPLSRQQGNPAINSQIATVSDPDQAADTLSLTATALTGSGVSVTNISIAANGTVTADVAASCTATNSTFTLTATDNQTATATTTLTLNVTLNTPPALGNYPTTAVNLGGSTIVTPDAAPVDNFAITSIAASAPAFTGTFSVDPMSGVVTVNNAAPVGAYTVTVTATDQCGETSFKTFTLEVICPTYTVNSLGDTGAGTGTTGDLRYCITQANAQLCNITINFSVTGVINLTSELPALDNNITFNGPGAALLGIHRNVATAFRIFRVNGGKTVSISGLTISNGQALHGGGIENNGTLTITDSVLTNNIATIMFTANDGGGAVFNNGALTITRSSFTGNHADNAVAGAIYNNFGATLNITDSILSNNVSCHGGAIHHRGSNLTVTSSTFSGNFSGVCGGGPGGAVSMFNAHATFTNCTISGNNTQFGSGSGISAFLGSITLLNCTITANGGETSIGSLVVQNATLNIKNSIVAGNTGGDIVNNGGTVNDQGNNILSGDPMLAPLGNYGGPTQTHALCTGSHAINAGNNAGAPATDQRGVSRPVGEKVDIGAFEAKITVDQSSIPSGTQFAPYAGQTFTASNGVAPYTFNLIGTLPAGMTFSDGTLSGTPTETGSLPIKIIATDSEGFAGAGCFTLIIECPTITLSPSSLPNGTGGVNYNQIVTASGGQDAYTFAVTAGALPPGLMLSSAGTLSGNPTATGTYNFTITATAANGCTGSQSYTISINMPPTITAADPLTRERGASASTSQIAVVADAEQAPNTLNVTATPLTGTGVTITGITIDAAGNVMASIVADCAATNSTFTLKVTDNLDVMATATLTVNTIPDSQPPVIICPANITQSTDPNLCSAVVSYTTPQATDNCPNPGTVICTPASGSAFPKGTTTVTCTVDDASGNTGSCSFSVTINDTQAPAISCPSNITQSTDADQCTAVVTFSPTAADNCPDVGIVSCKPASGSTFQKGVTSVTCTVADASGNINSCSFTVTVNDTQAPSMTCPANITQGNDNDQCAAIVNYTTPPATDNCPGVGAVTCNPPSGSAFPKGTTTVNCSVDDANGNNRSCNFTVTVNDTQTPTVNCPTNITTTTAVGLCSAVVTFSATPNDNCSAATASCTPASGSTFPKGVTTVTCRATDASGNQSTPCSFTVTVNDMQLPTISCPSNITKATDLNLCSAVVSYAAPVVSDNCPGLAAPVCVPPSGAVFPKGTSTVNCSVRDASNNQSSCLFSVTINDTQAPSLTCPPNQTRALASATDTTVIVDYPLPTYGDNCPGSTVVCNPPSGAAFPVGMTTVTCVATDSSGNQASCSFIVTTFDVCLQDDSNPATVILFNSFTGDYLFCCSGTTYSGKGTVQKQGNIYTLTHNTPARRVMARFDGAQKKGTASLQSPPGTNRCSINDRDTRNNTCACSSN